MYLQVVKWVLPLLLLAGCYNDAPGLHLEVRAGMTGAERVELYLATRKCAGCSNTMRPKGVSEILAGEVWLLDGDGATKTPNTVADVRSGSVVFDLEPPGTTKIDVAYVVAVGYGANDHVVGVAKLSAVTIPHDTATFAKVTLADAQELASSDELTPAGNRVWVWRRAGDQASALAACVGLEISDKTSVDRLWFVPEDDTDCDGVATKECDAYNFQANGSSSISAASCVTENLTDPEIDLGTCLVGGPACVDGVGSLACGAVKPYYCAPTNVCSLAACRQDLRACVNAGSTSFEKVTMPATMSGERCADPAVNVVSLDFAQFLGQSAARCKSLKFASLQVGSITLTSDFRPLGAVFTASGPGQSGRCAFTLTWAQGAPQIPNSFTFVDLELDNGTHELVPLRVEIVNSPCDNTVTPSAMPFVLPGEQIASCASVPK